MLIINTCNSQTTPTPNHEFSGNWKLSFSGEYFRIRGTNLSFQFQWDILRRSPFPELYYYSQESWEVNPCEGSEAYEFLESWDLNDRFASVFCNGSGNRIVLLSAKTNSFVGIGWKKHRQPVKQACFGCYPRSLQGGSNLIKKVQFMKRLS